MKKLLVVLLFCSNLHAYNFLPNAPYADKTKPIYWTADPQFHDATKIALAQWSEATDGVLNFIESDGTQTPNIIVQQGSLPSLEWGQALTNSKTVNGVITYFNSVVTIDPFLRLDNTATILHETGHALGMDHCGDGPWPFDRPIMNAVIDSTIKVLHKDDIDGIRALYGILTPYDHPLPITISKKVGRRYDFLVSDTADPALFHWGFGDSVTVTVIGLLGQNPIVHRYKKNGSYIVTVFFRGYTGTLSLTVGRQKRAKSLRKQQ